MLQYKSLLVQAESIGAVDAVFASTAIDLAHFRILDHGSYFARPSGLARAHPGGGHVQHVHPVLRRRHDQQPKYSKAICGTFVSPIFIQKKFSSDLHKLDFKLDSTLTGLNSAIVSAGCIFGGPMVGPIVDRWGRKAGLGVASVCIIFGVILQASAAGGTETICLGFFDKFIWIAYNSSQLFNSSSDGSLSASRL